MASRVREALRRRGKSQVWLARKLSMSESGLSQWLKGVNKIPLEGLAAIAAGLDLPIGYFTEDDPATTRVLRERGVPYGTVALDDPELVRLVEELVGLAGPNREAIKRRLRFELDESRRRAQEGTKGSQVPWDQPAT